MMQCPSDGSDPFRKINVFARAHTVYDAFDLTGYAICLVDK